MTISARIVRIENQVMPGCWMVPGNKEISVEMFNIKSVINHTMRRAKTYSMSTYGLKSQF